MHFGIIGYGRFGQLWANALAQLGTVFVYDTQPIVNTENKNIIPTNISEVVKTNILFILTPISAFATVCEDIQSLVTPATLIVDCCSVKVYPAKKMQTIFPQEQPIIATHPLFGPDSVKKSGGLAGHQIVVCPLSPHEDKLKVMTTLCEKLGLKILITSAEEHDRQMASSQGLVHFIGRGLTDLHLHTQMLATPDFQSLLHINQMVTNDTWQLFYDMHRYNPYTKNIRETFIQTLTKINDEVGNEIN